jgi:hypothetical protein
MTSQQPEEEQTYLPSASGVQDFYPPLPKDLPLPAATENGRNEAETPAAPTQEKPPSPDITTTTTTAAATTDGKSEKKSQ